MKTLDMKSMRWNALKVTTFMCAKNNHSPGPWQATNTEGSFSEAYIEAERWEEEGPIARLIPRDDATEADRERIRANAQLIAAAPELLAACKEFVRKCECGEARSRASYAQMKAAIEKAEVKDVR